jgi:NADH-quinone oxidoreductase subunit E
MTFSPQLEERFAKMLQSYPEGKKRSAVVPMLIYAQDETGAVTQELIEEVAKRCEVTPLQVDEVVGYYSMLHQYQLHARRWHRTLRPGLQEARCGPQADDR